jgi:hypothetical protein
MKRTTLSLAVGAHLAAGHIAAVTQAMARQQAAIDEGRRRVAEARAAEEKKQPEEAPK